MSKASYCLSIVSIEGTITEKKIFGWNLAQNYEFFSYSKIRFSENRMKIGHFVWKLNFWKIGQINENFYDRLEKCWSHKRYLFSISNHLGQFITLPSFMNAFKNRFYNALLHCYTKRQKLSSKLSVLKTCVKFTGKPLRWLSVLIKLHIILK